jgi:hypothetical protein
MIGMTLKEYLSVNRIDQGTFAKMIGSTQQSVSAWASGAVIPRRGVMARIAYATNGTVTANDFVDVVARASTSSEAAE